MQAPHPFDPTTDFATTDSLVGHWPEMLGLDGFRAYPIRELRDAADDSKGEGEGIETTEKIIRAT